MKKLLLLSALAVSAFLNPLAAQTTITINPSQDNTIFETPSGNSNGAGDHLFAGSTAGSSKRRALMAFDIAANVPAGSTINSVSLGMVVDNSVSGALPMTLNIVTTNWGEGASNAGLPGGNGAAAQPNDATWLNSFTPALLWTTAGGDFNLSASATTNVGGNGSYSWTSAQMVADVQNWLDAPATDFGWMLKGDESTTASAKRLCSRENATVANRPTLTITFTPPCVVANAPSLVATATTICSGGTTIITASGSLNNSTTWVLYENACGGTVVQSDPSGTFIINPTATTTYYVRGEGNCAGSGACSDITITVLPTASGTQTMTVCFGESVTVGGTTHSTSGVFIDLLTAFNGCDSAVITTLTVGPDLTSNQTINFCDAGSVTVGGITHSSNGVFIDVIPAFNGCDSTVVTSLIINTSVTTSQSITVCHGDSYTIGGTTHSSTGIFTDVLTSFTGCDSTVTTNLTVSNAITGSQVVSVCFGGSVTVGSSTYSSSGSFADVLTAANGCDSTVITNLTVRPAITHSQSFTVCHGGSVTVGGIIHNTTGIFVDLFTAFNGCDSTVTTNLTVSPAITQTQTVTVCHGGSITVGGIVHNTTGSFVDVLTAANGCDSTVTTNLTVSPAITHTQTMTVCAGGSITVGGIVHNTTGTFVDVLTAANGCDSTVTTNLTVSPAITHSQTITVCAGASVNVGGIIHNSTGIFVDVLTAFNGCDSSVTTHLTVSPAITGSQTVTVCNGGSVTVGTINHTNTGIFTDVLTAANGCDSTVTTNLTVLADNIHAQFFTVCDAGMIMVGGSMYMTSGTYTDTFTAFNGCDSTVVTTLTVRPVNATTQVFNMCSGGSVTVNGNVYNTTGIHIDILTDMNGCDSTVTTDLTVATSIVINNTTTICEGDSVVVGTHTYLTSGNYTDTFTAMAGCDSIVHTNLTVSPAITFSQTITVCAGGMVLVGGSMYMTSGTYVDVLTAINGCDSTVTTNLTVLPDNATTQTVSICFGDSLFVGAHFHFTTGIFTDVLSATNSCDSAVTTDLTVLPQNTATQTITVCAGGSITIGGSIHNITGTFVDVLTASNGCDSTLTTNLTVSPAITGSQTFNMCAGSSVTVGGTVYNSTGIYTDVLSAANGCDSTVTTDLTISTSITNSQSITVCFGDSITVGTSTYLSSGVYTDLFTAVGGCDSTVTTTLTVSPAIMATQTITLCFGDSVTVGANTYTASGIYSDMFTAMNGCDSTLTNTVIINPAIASMQTVTICAEDTLMVGGMIYTATGIYTDILVSAMGCDSIVTTDLTVMPAITNSQSIAICAGTSITVGGMVYSTSGIYTNVFTATNGCDSTLTTDLIVMPEISTTQMATVCAGGSVTVNGNTYNTTGFYADVYPAANGCDSIYYTDLTVSPAITATQNFLMCTGSSVIVGTNVYDTTGVYVDVFTAFNGCDSTLTTNLTIVDTIVLNQTVALCFGGNITIGTNTYDSDGIYTDTLTAWGGCDSIVTTNLSIMPLVTASQSVTICGGDTLVMGTFNYFTTGVYNSAFVTSQGCDSILTTTLTVLPLITNSQTITICGGDTLTVGTSVYTTSGTYTDVFPAMDGCDSTLTTNLTVTPVIASSQTFIMCSGSIVTVGGMMHDTTGIYVDVLTAFSGCDSTITTNLTISDSIVVNQTFTLCAGDSIVIGGITYDTTGVYSNMFIAIGGCDSTVVTTLIVNPAITASQMVTICDGQTLQVGINNYDSTGVYMDVFTAMNGCDSVLITNLTVLAPIVDTITPAFCQGGSIIVGTNTYNASGTYIDVLTSFNGCDSTVFTQLTVFPLPAISMVAFAPHYCIQGGVIALNQGSPLGGIYTDSGNGVTTSPNFNLALAGAGIDTITYTITDINNCTSSISRPMNIVDCTGIDELTSSENVTIYPNPNNGLFNISITNVMPGELNIVINDVEGRTVFASQEKAGAGLYNKQINLEELAKGLYYMKLSNGNQISIQKLVVQ